MIKNILARTSFIATAIADNAEDINNEDYGGIIMSDGTYLQQYQQVNTECGVVNASPHRLIQMLLEGALDKVNIAKGFMERGDIAKKGEFIDWAMKIIGGLEASLDKDNNYEISDNLSKLYHYMLERLLLANAENDATLLDEVSHLLNDIKAGWDGISEEAPGILAAAETPKTTHEAASEGGLLNLSG